MTAVGGLGIPPKRQRTTAWNALGRMGMQDEEENFNSLQSQINTIDGQLAQKVTGPGTSVDNRLAIFDGTTGKQIKDSTDITATGSTLTSTSSITLDTSDEVVLSNPNGARIIGANGVMFEETGAGTDTFRIVAPASLTGTQTIILPTTTGNAGDHWTTDGNNPATITWTAPPPAGGDVTGPASSVNQRLVTFNGVTGKIIQDGSNITLNGGTFASTNNVEFSTTQEFLMAAVNGFRVQGTNGVMLEETGVGTNLFRLRAPAALASDQAWIMPATPGMAGWFLTGDGMVPTTLSWTAPPSATTQLPGGYINGCKLVYSSASVVDVTAGTARDEDDKEDIIISATTGLDITLSGAGGLMTGQVEASNTTYEVWLMHDDTATNPDDAFLVPEGVTPAEAGYTHFRYVGAVHNSGSSNFLQFYTEGKSSSRMVFYDESFITMRVLSNGSSTTWATVMGSTDSVDDFCPIMSCSVLLQVVTEAALDTNPEVKFRPANSTEDHNLYSVETIGPEENSGFDSTTQLQVPLDSSRELEYEVSTNTVDIDVAVVGYRLEL